MALEKLVHGMGNLARKTVAGGLIGLTALGAGIGSVPAYAQQRDAKYAASTDNVVYVQCNPKKKDVNWGQILGVLGSVWGYHSNPNVQKLGGVASTAGLYKHQEEVAREGRTQVTINQGQGQSQAPQTTIYVFSPECSSLENLPFVANSYKNFNENNRPELNEFIGVKDRFRDDEDINLVFYNPKKNRDLNWELYDPQGRRIDGNSMKLKKREAAWVPLNRSWLDDVRANKAHGVYTVVWHSKGLTATNRFEIIPSSRQPQMSVNRNENSGLDRKIYTFASYPWEDSSPRDGYAQFPDEFPNYGQKEFKITEKIIFGLNDPQGQGTKRTIGWKVYGPRGKVSYSGSLKTNNGYTLLGQEKDANLTLFLVQNGGGYGNHRVEWTIDGVPAGSSSVKILPVHKE